MFEYSGAEWPYATEPVYGKFGAIKGEDNARTANGVVWFPMDTPAEAVEKMTFLKSTGRYDNLEFVVSPHAINLGR